MREYKWIHQTLYAISHCVCRRMLVRKQVLEEPEESYRSLWHQTRCFEFPWAAAQADARDCVCMDFGASEMFGLYMMEAQKPKLWVSHHIAEDTQQLGLMEMGHKFGQMSCKRVWLEDESRWRMLVAPLQEVDAFVKEASFDLIYMLSVVEHIPKEEVRAIVGTLFRLLKPGGRLILTADWIRNYPMGEGEEGKFWNHDMILHMTQSGFNLCDDEDTPMRGSLTVPEIADDVIWFDWPCQMGIQYTVYGLVGVKP